MVRSLVLPRQPIPKTQIHNIAYAQRNKVNNLFDSSAVIAGKNISPGANLFIGVRNMRHSDKVSIVATR